jgi:hypothetical protein
MFQVNVEEPLLIISPGFPSEVTSTQEAQPAALPDPPIHQVTPSFHTSTLSFSLEKLPVVVPITACRKHARFGVTGAIR